MGKLARFSMSFKHQNLYTMRNFLMLIVRYMLYSHKPEFWDISPMKASLRLRLDQLCDRHEELTALLADVEVISDNKRFRKLSREHNDLTEITEVWGKYRQAEEDIETAEMMKSAPDFKDMAEEEIKANK